MDIDTSSELSLIALREGLVGEMTAMLDHVAYSASNAKVTSAHHGDTTAQTMPAVGFPCVNILAKLRKAVLEDRKCPMATGRWVRT